MSADSGYQGLLSLHENSRTPFKKPKGGELTAEQKEFNKQLASERIIVEHNYPAFENLSPLERTLPESPPPLYVADEFDCRFV